MGFGGLYGRYDAGAAFLNAALTGGVLSNSTIRNVNSNLAQNGIETAMGSFGGWFIEPEVSLGYGLALPGRFTLTPALKARYLGAELSGYTETGSDTGIAIASRMLQDLEERAELSLARTMTLGSQSELRLSVHGGVLEAERVGGAAVNVGLLGQSMTFMAPGKDFVSGAYGGADMHFRVGDGLSLFLSGEYTATNDPSSLVTAKGGLRWQF